MATANQELFDASVRHQVALRRFATGEANRVLQILEQADRELTRQLRERLAKMEGVRDFTSERLQRLLADVRAARVETMKAAREAARDDLVGLSKQEATFETRLLKASIPIQIDLAAVSLTNLRQLVTRELIEGRTLGQWFSSIERADRTRIEAAVQQGIVQGLSIPDIVARVSGTRANNFTDGALAMTRRQAETVVRTAVNHVSNSAREEVWEANSDIILALRWTATLDGRTSAICRARDGKLAPVGDKPLPAGSDALDPPGARPPAHPNCLPGDCLVLPCGGIAAATERYYEGEVVIVRTADGHELTCTPNHPVLTDRGWIPAQRLQEGCRVVRYLGRQDPLPQIESEHHDGPAPIEEVAAPLLEGPGLEFRTTSRRDFHGDGTDSEVCVVGINRRLNAVESQAAVAQHLREEGFQGGARIVAPLPREGAATKLLEGCPTTTNRLVRGRDLVAALLGGSEVPDSLGSRASPGSLLGIPPGEASGIGLVPDRDAALPEDPVEDDPAELAVAVEVIDALAGKVALDEVAHVGWRDFSGHVYNLQTASGIYFTTSGGVITHNCRSVMIAVTDADGIVGSRPFVTDTRTREEREIDFRKMAREQGRPISEIRKEWAERNVGTLPAGTTYEEWLRRQSAEFQDDVLGAEKGRLFREEGLRLDQFVDSSGRELSLEELGAAPPAPVTEAVDAFPVAQDVRERMEAIRSVPEDLNLRDEFGPGGGLEDHRASYFIRQWTESTDFVSEDVARIVDGTATPRMVKSAADQTIGEGEIDPKNFEAGVKEYYAWTQRGLEDKGLDEYVTLYRGIRSDQAAQIGRAVLSGTEGDVQISLSGLSSFTTDRKIAESFGSVVVEYRAHRSRIFASYLTDRNLIGEREVVVLSGKDPISLSKERLAISTNARWGFRTWQDVVDGDGGEI